MVAKRISNERIYIYIYLSIYIKEKIGQITQKQPRRPNESANPNALLHDEYRQIIWTRLESAIDSMYTAYTEVHTLEKVLSKKRDPVTFICFVDDVITVSKMN